MGHPTNHIHNISIQTKGGHIVIFGLIFAVIVMVFLIHYAQGATVSISPSVPDVMSRLEELGQNPVPVRNIRRSFFSVVGKIVTMDGDNFQIFKYPDAQTALSEVLIFKQSAGTRLGAWKKRVHLYVIDATIIFYMGNKPHILQSLGGVMGSPIPL